MADITLAEVIKEINKKYSTDKFQVMSLGVSKIAERGTLSLGSPSLDFCLYNSLPEGCMIEISGSESSGKTTLAYLIANSYIRKELQRNPTEPRKILFIDAECSADPEWALASTGYDMNRTDVPTCHFMPSGQSAEEIFDIVVTCVKTGEVGLVIFDSLTAIVSQQLVDESLSKKEMGGIAMALGTFCKKITGLLNRSKTTFIGINGVTENLTQYGEKEQTPGGRTWKRACMVRVKAKRGDFFDDSGEVIAKKDAQSPAGHIIEMYVYKTKVCRWDRKLGRCHLNYVRGIDILQDTIDTAVLLGLIDTSVQGSFKLMDVEHNKPLLDSNGAEIKIRGRKNLKPFFEQHKELWRQLYNKCYEMMSVKETPYAISFEQMLNVDVGEVENEEE